MKVLHLSTGDSRGAFYGAYRTHSNLQRYGHDSTMCVIEKTSGDDNVIAVSGFKPSVTKNLGKIIRRIIVKRDSERNKIFLLYNTTFSVNEIKKKYQEKPDLIIVYFVADFLSDNDIFVLQQHFQCPVAFYLMDAGMLTGGCHYPWDCKGYENFCQICPIIKFSNLLPLAENVIRRRTRLYGKMDSIYLSASHWLDKKCAATTIKPKYGVSKTLIGIDERVFSPKSRVEASKKLNVDLPKDKIVFLLGAQSLKDERKGFKYFLDALTILEKNMDLSSIVILTIGGSEINNFGSFSQINIDFIHDKKLYPYIYNLADAFICPSIEDAGPMMINESIISGLPVISFDIGVASDLIINGETGYIAKDISAIALAESLRSFINLEKENRIQMNDNCRQLALETTSAEVQVNNLIRLVEEIKYKKKGENNMFDNKYN